jgi:hypothetical protein
VLHFLYLPLRTLRDAEPQWPFVKTEVTDCDKTSGSPMVTIRHPELSYILLEMGAQFADVLDRLSR